MSSNNGDKWDGNNDFIEELIAENIDLMTENIRLAFENRRLKERNRSIENFYKAFGLRMILKEESYKN